jgi:hypothetical protein
LAAFGYDRRMRRTIVLTGMLLLLVACGQRDTDPGPGGVTVGEARALDEAAEMIEARRLPEEALATGTPTPSPASSSAGENMLRHFAFHAPRAAAVIRAEAE